MQSQLPGKNTSTKEIFQMTFQKFIINCTDYKYISKKLFELSQQGIPTLAQEWHKKIFNKEMPRPDMSAPLPKEDYEKIDLFQRWVDTMTKNITITQSQKEMLKDAWDILNCITCTRTAQISDKFQEELKDILTSPAAQDLICGSTHFRQELEREVYEEIDGDEYALSRWEGWWPEVFGCDF